MKGKGGEIRFESIVSRKWTVSKFKTDVMPGHTCRKKCATCKKDWGETDTEFVSYAMDEGNKTNFICDWCLKSANQTRAIFVCRELPNLPNPVPMTVQAPQGLELYAGHDTFIKQSFTYYAIHNEGVKHIVLAVDLTDFKALVSGPGVKKINMLDFTDWHHRSKLDSEERKYVEAHLPNYYK